MCENNQKDIIYVLIRQYSDYEDSTETFLLACFNENIIKTMCNTLNSLKEEKVSYKWEAVKVI